MTGREFFAVDASAMPWEEVFRENVGRPFHKKDLFTDAETEVEVALVRYPAGLINPNHTHPCGHGMYVLEGRLVTHKGVWPWDIRLVPTR